MSEQEHSELDDIEPLDDLVETQDSIKESEMDIDDPQVEVIPPKHMPPVEHRFPNQKCGRKRTKIEIAGMGDKVCSWMANGLPAAAIQEKLLSLYDIQVSINTVYNFRDDVYEPFVKKLDKEHLKELKGYDDDGTPISDEARFTNAVFIDFENKLRYANESVEFWDKRMAEILSMGPAMYTTNATIHKSLIIAKQQHEKYVEKLDKLKNGDNGLVTIKLDTMRKMADIAVRLFTPEITDEAKRAELVARFKELMRTV